MNTTPRDSLAARFDWIWLLLWLGAVVAAPTLIFLSLRELHAPSLGWWTLGGAVLAHLMACLKIGEGHGPAAGTWALLGGWFVMAMAVFAGCWSVFERI